MTVLRKRSVFAIVCVLFTLATLGRSAPSYPPDPKNAALLYYQAFLTVPQEEEPADGQLHDYAIGKAELNKAVEHYIDSCRGAIGLAVEASQLADCDWGLQYSQGFNMILAHLGQMRSLARIMIADARIQASKGNDELAFERCITVYKMSRHVGDKVIISFLVNVAMEAMGGGCIGDLLGEKQADAKLLESMKKELAAFAKNAPSPDRSLDLERKVFVEQIKMENIGDLMKAIDTKKSTDEVLKEIEKFGGEEFLKKSRDYYSSYMRSIMDILRSGKPYPEMHKQLAELAAGLEKQREKTPEATFTLAVAPAVSKIYTNMIRSRTQANALRTAVEIHLTKAKIGKLPDSLPAGSPKDLFSGKDFEYEKTKTGFLLRCRGKDRDKNKVQEYEFAVAK